MTEEEFINLVKNAEREVSSNSGLYKLKVAMLAILGYVVIFLILSVLALLVGGSVASLFFSTSLAILLLKKKLIIPVVVAAWVMLKALWVRFEKPEGYELKRSEFPELFAEIDGLRKQLNSLPIHRVLLTHELNASVIQTPRLGVFGWQHNTLILGIELLLTLSPEEARSVLAHELGHLSGNHSQFAGWIYRVRLTWHRIMTAFQDADSWGNKAMQRFFNWYAPYFSAYSFALARSNEYEADAMAAKLTSADAAARALVHVHVTSPYTDRSYWERYFKKADELAEPDHMPYAGLARFLGESLPSDDEVRDRMEQAMQRETSYADTHPALRDRLHALGRAPESSFVRCEKNAAVLWLGKGLDKVLGDFDRMWYDANKEKWANRHDYVQGSLRALSELEAKDPADLTDRELWDKAAWTEEFRSETDPLPLYQQYKQRVPDDPDADYVIGRILAQREDPSCIGYLETAATNTALLVPACKVAYAFLMEQQKEEEADVWRERALAQMEVEETMQAERAAVAANDELRAVDLSDEDRQSIIEQLAAAKNLKQAWIAQKVLSHHPEQDPVYIVAFKAKGFYWSWDNVIDRVMKDLRLPVKVFFIVNGGEYRTLAKRVMKAGERII